MAPRRETAGEVLLLRPPSGWVGPQLAELWQHRELLGFLAWRDVRVRYKQSALGVAWAVLQPLLTMVVFTVLFGALLGRRGMPSPEGVPYALSTYCALVPWQLFAAALASSSQSLVANQSLITKVYFPRLVAPIAPVGAALFDFSLSLGVLLGLAFALGFPPGAGLLWLPPLALLAALCALSVGLWLSALNALYRDVHHAVPFLLQLWMFATPVVYDAASLLGDRSSFWWVVYGLNPMAGVIEGFRFALLGAPAPPASLWLTGLPVTALLLLGGLFFFRRLERSFADLV